MPPARFLPIVTFPVNCFAHAIRYYPGNPTAEVEVIAGFISSCFRADAR